MTHFDVNPYAPAPPLEPRTDSADDAIQFSGAVQWEDLERFGRHGMGIYAGCLAWLATTVVYVGMLWLLLAPINEKLPVNNQWTNTVPVYPLLFAAFSAQVAACMWITMRFMGYLYARINIAATPELLGPISGKLVAGKLELVYPHTRKVLLLSAISELRKSADGIGLLIGDDRSSLILLPRHQFEEREFAGVRDRIGTAILNHQVTALPQNGETDPLKADSVDPSLVTMPEDAEAFTGGLLLSDCHWTQACREQVVRIYGVFGCALASVLMIFLPVAIFSPIHMMRWHVFAVAIGLVVLFLLVHIAAAFWRLWSIKGSSSAPIAGWVASDGLTVNTPFGSTTYCPAAFHRIESSARSMQLVLPGQPQQTLVLSKPMFRSTTGFDRLLLWASR